jgi:ATP-binding cassette subfamily D (ALD) protein 4
MMFVVEKEKNEDLVRHATDTTNKMAAKRQFALDWIFVKRFHRLCHVFLYRKDLTLLILTSLLLVSFLEQFFVYGVGMVSSGFLKVMTQKDAKGFVRQVLKSVLLFTAISLIMSAKEYVAASLRLSWRKIITNHLHNLYFDQESFYDANVKSSNDDVRESKIFLDNPDQRMTADVNEFVINFSKVLPLLLISPFVIAYYSYKSFAAVGKSALKKSP